MDYDSLAKLSLSVNHICPHKVSSLLSAVVICEAHHLWASKRVSVERIKILLHELLNVQRLAEVRAISSSGLVSFLPENVVGRS